MKERRKLKRKYMVFFGRVFDLTTTQPIGNVADITPAGIMIISNQPIELNKVFKLRLDLPEHIFGIDHLDLEGRSIWQSPDIDPMHYNTGFKLLNITPEQTDIIDRIIQEYGIRG
jgi:hypothetical protein